MQDVKTSNATILPCHDEMAPIDQNSNGTFNIVYKIRTVRE
jgi:hypothetical protein